MNELKFKLTHNFIFLYFDYNYLDHFKTSYHYFLKLSGKFPCREQKALVKGYYYLFLFF